MNMEKKSSQKQCTPPPNEKVILKWRRQEEQSKKANISKCCYQSLTAKWPELEQVKNLVCHRNKGAFYSPQNMVPFFCVTRQNECLLMKVSALCVGKVTSLSIFPVLLLFTKNTHLFNGL